MWIVVAKKGTYVHRDDMISDILEISREESEDFKEFYVTKNSSNFRYNVVASIFYAKIYKSKGYCEKIVNRFQFYKNSDYIRNPFHWLKDYHLSYRKITKEEWETVCNNELKKLEQSYIHHKSLIERKKSMYK